MIIERILSATDKGVEALEKTDRNMVALNNEVIAHKAESASKHIKESGSNTNGIYIKFDDGTMICITTQATLSVTAAVSPLYRSSEATRTFAATFIEPPKAVFVNASMDLLTQFIIGNILSSTATTVRVRLFSNAVTTDTPYIITAIGRWK